MTSIIVLHIISSLLPWLVTVLKPSFRSYILEPKLVILHKRGVTVKCCLAHMRELTDSVHFAQALNCNLMRLVHMRGLADSVKIAHPQCC